MKCPFGCGWEGPEEKYLQHFDKCPNKVCPECGSNNTFFLAVDKIECISCGHIWPKSKAPPKKEIFKTFKTENEFMTWLAENGLTAEARPGTGIFRGEDHVASYLDTKEGIEVDLVNAETWRIRNETFLKIETENGLALVEEPVETPVEEAGEPS